MFRQPSNRCKVMLKSRSWYFSSIIRCLSAASIAAAAAIGTGLLILMFLRQSPDIRLALNNAWWILGVIFVVFLAEKLTRPNLGPSALPPPASSMPGPPFSARAFITRTALGLLAGLMLLRLLIDIVGANIGEFVSNSGLQTPAFDGDDLQRTVLGHVLLVIMTGPPIVFAAMQRVPDRAIGLWHCLAAAVLAVTGGMAASIVHDLVTGRSMTAMLLEMPTAPGLLPLFWTMEPLIALGVAVVVAIMLRVGLLVGRVLGGPSP
jgi:hypothetical protein